MTCNFTTLRARLTLLTLALALAPTIAHAANWSTATTDNWTTAARWDTANVPNIPGETANISVAGTYTVSLNAGFNPSIDSFSLNSANATLSVDGSSLTTSGAFNIASGSAIWRGAAGTANINSGGWTNSGLFRLGGTSGVQNDITITDAAALTNNGTIEVIRTNGWGSRLRVGGAASINNAAGATIKLSSIAPHSGEIILQSDISNSGAVIIDVNSPSEFPKASGSYTNAAATSTFTVSSALSVTGASSTFLQTNGTTTINSGGGSISGLSSFTMNGGGLSNNGSLSAGTFTQNGGTISGTGTISVGAGGTVNLNTGSHSGSVSLVVGSGSGAATTLAIGAGYAYNFNTTMSGSGTITGPFTVASGRTFTITGAGAPPQPKTVLAPAFTNFGTITHGTAGTGWHTQLSVPTGTLTNAVGGIYNMIDGAGSGASVEILAEMNNLGTLNVNTNSTAPSLGRAGAAHVNAGTINVNDPFTVTGASFTQTGGQIVLGAPMTISTTTKSFPGGMIAGGGAGNSLNSVVNATAAGTGLTISPGTLTNVLQINGNVTLDSNDAIAIELGGTTQGAPINGYDHLIVSGTLDITGATLNLDVINGFEPSQFDTFTIITATNRIGQFSNTPGDQITAGVYTFDVTYTATQVILSNAVSSVPEPSTLVLLGLGSLVLVRRRRRK